MDKTGSTSTLAPKTSRRNFFQWAVKWFYANVPEDTTRKFDIPSIICLLQAAGFKLREFDKRNQVIVTNDELKSNNIRITVECGTSKMTAVLEMDDVKCECRDNNEANEGSLWSITGTGPMSSMDNINKFEETGSSLLPDMSKETTTVVRDVVHRLIKIINNCDDDQSLDLNANSPIKGVNTTITKNSEVREGLIRSYTDLCDQKPRTLVKLNSNLANAKCISSSKSIKGFGVLEKPKLKRQGTYDLEDESMEEPRPSPPKLASSPVLNQLCTSLGQISLQSEEENLGLADYVVKAHQILDKAVNVIIKKLPNQSMSQDDGNFVKPAPPSAMNSSFCASSPRVRASSMVSRTVSNASSRSSSSTSSSCRITPVDTTLNRSTMSQKNTVTSKLSTLPAMRDRSSSMSATQRPVPGLKTLTTQRRSANFTSTLTAAPRPASANSKVPSSKTTQTRSLVVERSVLLTKRRSPDVKSQSSSPALSLQTRGNTSLIKAPSTMVRPNVSAKFGYTTSKK
ncbi:uncharacterized protein LOC131665908 [Phymastichus coffea]|uniref:uncharacterized protein LOC131665908 n=1 Tax=Phymastichus coffea TaxID=108790 RepID=UPI00273C9D39|nr:uncharacterized protein LOC131665908 [Phymastichus coffea]